MSLEDFTAYIAKGETLELAREHFAKREVAREARKAHAKRHGGEQAIPYGDDFTYLGITTPMPPDAKAWRVAPKSRRVPVDAEWPCYIPNTRTKEGKALEEEMGNCYSGHGRHPVFSLPDSRDFSEELGFGLETGTCEGGLCMLYARVGQIGDEVVVLVPKQFKKKASPPDSEQIPYSRYYAMQEAAEKAES